MTARRKPLVVAGVVIACLVATLLLAPRLVRDQVEARVRTEIDQSVSADVDWGGMGLTLFRDFPNLTVGLDDLTVVGLDRFEGDTLASVPSFRLVLDLGSVLRGLRGRGPVVVRSVRLDEPSVSLRVLEDGAGNWDIARTREDDTTSGEEPSRGLEVELREFTISDGRLVLDDASSGAFVSLEGIRHTLDGDFSGDSARIHSRTHADGTTVRFAGRPYLAGVTLDFEADIGADLEEKRFAFQDNELRLNELVLRFAGEAVATDGAVTVDVAFSTPSSDFGQALSLIPAVHGPDFESLETSGTFSVDGTLRGAFAESSLPALALSVTVDDGMFRYPDLPLPARAISLDLAVDKPEGDLDAAVVRLSRFHAEIGGQPIDASLALRTPKSDPDVDADVRGTLDLADLARTVKLESVERLSGLVTADASIHARRSDVEAGRYERVESSGSVSARDVTLEAEGLRQPVAVEEATLELTPRAAELRSFRASIGSSDVQATGGIENLLGFLMRDEPLRGSATFTSQRFVLDEWRSEDPDLDVVPVPAMLDMALNGSVDQLVYRGLEMSNARGGLRVADQRLTLEGFGLETLGGRIGLSGHYETTDPARPTFSLELNLDSLDIARASQAFLTVRTLAPVAEYARGTFTADLDLTGAFGKDLTPIFDALQGGGSLLTSRIEIEGFPLLERLAEAVKLPRLSHPTIEALRSSIEVRDGRLHVLPFRVGTGGLDLRVSGSNGFDRSLDYTLSLAVPRSLLGNEAARVVEELATRAGRLGVNLQGADSVRLGIRVTGTVGDPSLDLGFGEAFESVREQAERAAEEAVERRIDEAREELDEAEEEARRRARARADSLVAAAEERADTVRAEARRLAERIREEGDQRADQVLERATNPVARLAAQPVAERIRQEADEEATRLEEEADQRADTLVAEARRRAAEVDGSGEM